MRATNSPRRDPSGFTLIELLVVISIIGVLMGLLLGAVQKVRDVGRRTTTVSEINQLDMAATKFKLDFGFNPPHYIRLPDVVPDQSWFNMTPGSAQKECYDGYALLLRFFPRWQIPGVGSASAALNPGNVPVTVGQPTGLSFRTTPVPAGGQVICGSQCLVFFLGGPELQGFAATGPYPPAAASTSKKAPYFDFVANRVDVSDDPTDKFSYRDPYGTPYAYFSTVSATNYDLAYSWPVMSAPTAALVPVPNPMATSQPTLQMRAYLEPSGKPINPGRIQIISAGKNKRFGPGTVVTPVTPATTPATYTYTYWSPGSTGYMLDAAAPAGDGGDDLANFNGSIQLGVVPN